MRCTHRGRGDGRHHHRLGGPEDDVVVRAVAVRVLGSAGLRRETARDDAGPTGRPGGGEGWACAAHTAERRRRAGGSGPTPGPVRLRRLGAVRLGASSVWETTTNQKRVKIHSARVAHHHSSIFFFRPVC